MKGPSGDPGAKPPKALVFFNVKTTFLNVNLYRHKIVNIGLGRFSTLGGSNNCERSEQSERLREAFTGVQGAGPLVRKFCSFQVKYTYFQALCGLNLQKYMIWGLQGGS